VTAPILPQSLFVVLTGAVGSGKSWQVQRLLLAEVGGQRVCAPAVYGLAEASAEGTAGEVLLDPAACLVWPVADCDEALLMVRTCFPSSGPLTLGAARAALHKLQVERALAEKAVPPPQPAATPRDGETLRACVLDTATTLYKGSVAKAGRLFRAEAIAKAKGDRSAAQRAGKQDAPYNDDRQAHGWAARVCKDLIDALGGLNRHRGLVVLVTVHTRAAMQTTVTKTASGQDEVRSVAVGEAPNLGSSKDVQQGILVSAYSETWDTLAAKANVIWHCYASVPVLSGEQDDDVNAAAEAVGVRHGVITLRASYKRLGSILWAKRQGGEGPLGIFASLPAVWHPDVKNALVVAHGEKYKHPDLGVVVSQAVEAYLAEQEGK